MYHLFYILSKDIKRKNRKTGTRMGWIKAKNGDFIEKLTQITQITQIILRARTGIIFEHG